MENEPKFRFNRRSPLMDQVRDALRYDDYVLQTERTYCRWIVWYLTLSFEFIQGI